MPDILDDLLWCAALATWLMLLFAFLSNALKPISKSIRRLIQKAFSAFAGYFVPLIFDRDAMFHSDEGPGVRHRRLDHGRSEPFLRVPGYNSWGDEGGHRYDDQISRCDCDSCCCRLYWTSRHFPRLAASRKAVYAGRHAIGVPASRVRGSVFASVR